MSKYATHNWYTLAFDADAIADVIPEDYEHRNGSVWEGYDLSHAIEWMREYNEDGRTLFRVSVSVEAVDVEGVSPPQPGPVKPWHEYHGNEKVHMPNSEAVSVEVGLPKSYTAEERAKMIALRVIDDVRSVYDRETADFVAECFHQHDDGTGGQGS